MDLEALRKLETSFANIDLGKKKGEAKDEMSEDGLSSVE